MSKKIVTVKIVAEMEVDSNWYDGLITDRDVTNEDIKNIEGDNWVEWINNHIKSEEISVRDVKNEK